MIQNQPTSAKTSTVDEYRARDIGLSSCLYATEGIKLLRIEKSSEGYFWFVFSDYELCKFIATAYFCDALGVEDAKGVFDARKLLLDKIHAFSGQ